MTSRADVALSESIDDLEQLKRDKELLDAFHKEEDALRESLKCISSCDSLDIESVLKNRREEVIDSVVTALKGSTRKVCLAKKVRYNFLFLPLPSVLIFFLNLLLQTDSGAFFVSTLFDLVMTLFVLAFIGHRFMSVHINELRFCDCDRCRLIRLTTR